MSNLIHTAIQILFKPRASAKELIEKNETSIAFRYFLVSVLVTTLYVFALEPNPGRNPFWIQLISVLGISLLGTSVSLFVPSLLLNIFGILFKGKCKLKTTLLSLAWTSGPVLLVILPTIFLFFLLDLGLDTGILNLSEEMIVVTLYLFQGITYLALLIKIPSQIVFLSEAYELSIFKIIMVHLSAIGFSIFASISTVVIFYSWL